MTDPVPDAGHENTTREHEDAATVIASTAGPTISNPSPPTGNDESHDNGGKGDHGDDDGAEDTTEAADDDDEEDDDDDEEEDEEDEDEDDEPRLKYARLTQHLGGVYRNADATSSFLVAGDKMVVGTHNGNIVCP